jgi:hypothetical protein
MLAQSWDHHTESSDARQLTCSSKPVELLLVKKFEHDRDLKQVFKRVRRNETIVNIQFGNEHDRRQQVKQVSIEID